MCGSTGSGLWGTAGGAEVSVTTGISLGIALLVLGAGHANAQAAVPDAGYSKSFQCPESLPTKEAREEAVLKFIAWAQQAHPEWTVEEFVEYRTQLLVDHHCDATLAIIKRNSVAPVPNSVRYRCPDKAGRAFFTNRLTEACVPVPLTAGWTNFVENSEFLLDIQMSTVVREAGGVLIWTHYYLAEPLGTSDGWEYDEMIARSTFYCGKRQTKLLEGTYRLRGQVVHTATQAEAYLEEVEPGTLSEDLYLQLCPA